MEPDLIQSTFSELELKLALPSPDRESLAQRLGRVPELKRIKPTHQHLHNVYFDTPAHTLRQMAVALRIRRVGSAVRPLWFQTLKTGGSSESALSRRGEWETPNANGRLRMDVLDATPWVEWDPDGRLFKALGAVFATTFERTNWVVCGPEGSQVALALDIGHIVAGAQRAPICELELELLAGKPAALFDLARHIATTVAILPANLSKAERGYALAEGCLDAPRCAHPIELGRDVSLAQAAGRLLRDMFCQFTTNLNALCVSDDPEVVHQARVGWRRFKSGLRLFQPALPVGSAPSWRGLGALLKCLAELRDIDVARFETLPALAQAFVAEDESRQKAWQRMSQTLTDAARLQRQATREALDQPAVGVALLAATQWLEELCAAPAPADQDVGSEVSLRRWSRQRMAQHHLKLKMARAVAHKAQNAQHSQNADVQHRVRILAKRVRYGVEALHSFLPKRKAKRWHQRATKLQQRLGSRRDALQVVVLLSKLQIDRGLVEFLRGVEAGRGWQESRHHGVCGSKRPL